MDQKTNNKKSKEIIFEEANAVLAENQQDFNPLPVNINPELPEVPFTAMFVLTPEQLEMIKANEGRLYITQCTYGNAFHAISVDINKPQSMSTMNKAELMAHFKKMQLAQKELELEQLRNEIKQNDAAKKKGSKKPIIKKLPDNGEKLVN